MIKIRLRRNLLYLLVLYICSYSRQIVILLINQIFNIDIPYVYFFLMTLGQIIGGASIYIYQIRAWKHKKKVKYFGLELIHQKIRIEPQDNIYKIILLIFFASFYDFVVFIIGYFHIPKISNISPTIDSRLGCISTISSSLICTHILKFKIGKHHKWSLRSLGICLIITIILELVYNYNDITIVRFIYAHFLVCVYLINITFTDCTERYIVDHNFLNPFIIIMIEGLFEFIMASIYSIENAPFEELINQYNKGGTLMFILLIFLLILYLVFSAGINAYKTYINVIFSPMARSLMDFLLNPFFNIYYFIEEEDFKQNWAYFILSEILGIIIDFLSFIYNEYIILYFCGFEYDTKDEIALRAKIAELAPSDYSVNTEDSNTDHSINIIENENESVYSISEME